MLKKHAIFLKYGVQNELGSLPNTLNVVFKFNGFILYYNIKHN